jgi:hypothetical protein
MILLDIWFMTQVLSPGLAHDNLKIQSDSEQIKREVYGFNFKPNKYHQINWNLESSSVMYVIFVEFLQETI